MDIVRALWRSTVGKKAVMALTGGFLFGWLLLHLAGNLLVFSGPASIDGYSALVHSHSFLLWLMRAALLTAITLHGVAAWQLAQRAKQARPTRYAFHRLKAATLTARTMRWGGVLLLGFILFHLLHMTFGAVHPAFWPGSVYHNLVSGLRSPAIAFFYIFGVTTLALHLHHGIWSAPRSLGLAGAARVPPRRRISAMVAISLWIGFCAVPIAILCGLLR